MTRIYNFSPGPSVLPLPVLERAQKDLLDWPGAGHSVMEMSHRSKWFETIIGDAREKLRTLMNIPANYSILFLQGGASLQFAMVPYNLMPAGGCADYVDSGSFASKALEEGLRLGDARAIASSKQDGYAYVPQVDFAKLSPGAAYLHITTNNTIFGTRWPAIPDSPVPLVADMSSNIMGEVYDVSKFALIYAGAQKNIGPAGLTVVIIREDMIGHARPGTPTMLDYRTHDKSDSLYNTPCCWAIYVAGLVFDWLLEQGGVPAIEEVNRQKAALLYDVIDNSSLYTGVARPDCRSLMNVTFTLPTQELTAAFVNDAKNRGLISLKGHRSAGGIRASIYNAMPVEGVQALAQFMKDFEAAN
ncbi:MAG: 3-phosphoserine/phosphohydroxythreonine transaminase [Clostridiales bacterium]|nr:3-phosphoserine/phosphohydroxythreonine transaminase [Clostridiales bacterium]